MNTVASVMRVHTVCVTADLTLAEALERLDLYQVTELPVVSPAGMLQGVLLEADVLDALNELSVSMNESKIESLIRDAHTVSPTSLLDDAKRKLEASGYRRLIVVEDDRVVGVVGGVELCRGVLGIEA